MTKIFVPDSKYLPLHQSWTDAAQNIGCSITREPARKVACIRDVDAIYVSSLDVDFISKPNLKVLMDRTLYHTVGVPVIPSHVPSSPDDLGFFGDGPIFVKPACTYHAPVGAMGDNTPNNRGLPGAYSAWSSPDHARAGLGSTFWSYQASPGYLGPMVIQPLYGLKVDMPAYEVAINESNEVFVFEATCADALHGFYRHNGLHTIVPDPVCVEHIKSIAKTLNIRGGLHYVQFIYGDGCMRLMDWNPRTSNFFESGYGVKPGQLEAAFSHVVGLPYQYDPLSTWFRQEVFRDDDITQEQVDFAVSRGFKPRTNYRFSPGKLLDALLYVGSSEQECISAFQELKAAW